MRKEIDDYFDFSDDGRGVFQLFPSVFNDDRGWFAEMLRSEHNIIDIKQINRSCSKAGVIRGCHAQRGHFCQAKLVEAVNTDLIDVITDARPTSKTFGKSKMYLLSEKMQNKLYVPRGFLHAFIVPHSAQSMAYFNYYCDNVYDKASEICINPIDVIQPLVDDINWNDIVQVGTFGVLFDTKQMTMTDDEQTSSHKINVSEEFNIAERDSNGLPLEDFLAAVKDDYKLTGKNWYE